MTPHAGHVVQLHDVVDSQSPKRSKRTVPGSDIVKIYVFIRHRSETECNARLRDERDALGIEMAASG